LNNSTRLDIVDDNDNIDNIDEIEGLVEEYAKIDLNTEYLDSFNISTDENRSC
jgi:hypothetical protein